MIETPEEFVRRLPWMSINGEPDFKQWENHLRHRDAAISADERQKAAKKKAELLDAAKAYKDLCACYRIGKQPTEKLFSRLEKAKAAIMAEPKEGV